MQKFNTTAHGLTSLQFTGTKAFDCLKNDPVFNNMINKRHLRRNFQIWCLNPTEKSEKTLITKYFVTIDIVVSFLCSSYT